MRIYNRKKRAISLVMAIMVMSNSIQITGLAEGEKEEGKKIIISEFQELPEELSSMKVPEGTSQEEFEKLFPDTLMVKTYRDDAEEQKTGTANVSRNTSRTGWDPETVRGGDARR